MMWQFINLIYCQFNWQKLPPKDNLVIVLNEKSIKYCRHYKKNWVVMVQWIRHMPLEWKTVRHQCVP